MTAASARESPGVAGAANPANAEVRRVLFIGLSYYSYTTAIIEGLRDKGFAVTYYPAEKRGFWSKTLKKLLPAIYQSRLRRYHERVIATEAATPYDFVFFLQIHSVSLEHVARLRTTQPRAKFVLYNWDSLVAHNYRPYLTFLDAVFTFDRHDAATVSARYLPLFALPEYFATPRQGGLKHDIYFVGAIGSLDRFEAVRKLADYCDQHGIRFARHLHCSPAILLKLLRKGLFMDGLSLRPLSTGEIVRLMNASAAVFDVPNRTQSGYTMRLIENLCAGRKIVTSNVLVREETFFSSAQFFVVDDLDFIGLKEFLGTDDHVKRDWREFPPHTEFSLDHWLDRIFEG